MSRPAYSVIICSVDRSKFDGACANYRRLIPENELELIGIHDAKSLAEGYNRGIDRSRGELLIFAHDDVRIHSPTFAAQLAKYSTQFDVFGVAGTSKLVYPTWISAGPPFIFGQIAHYNAPHYTVCMYGAPTRSVANIQAIDGAFIAASRSVAQSIRFDADTFDGFHLYDMDFSFRAHLAAHRLGVCCDLDAFHDSGGIGGETHRKYVDAFLRKHGDRLAKAEPRQHGFAWVHAMSEREAIERMRPTYWG